MKSIFGGILFLISFNFLSAQQEGENSKVARFSAGERLLSGNFLMMAPNKGQNDLFNLSHKKYAFPKHIQENPLGLSFFCRMEVAVEKKLPMGLWIKIDETPEIDNGPINQAYFRLKLFKF